MSNVTNATSILYGTFLDIQSEVKTWLQIPSGDTSRDANIQLITDMACQWVQNWLGRPIAPQQYDRRFDGWSGLNGAYLELPWYPVLEIVSVTEYWGIAGPHTLVESTPTNQVDGWQCVYQTGRMTRVFPGNVQKPWFPGSRNVEIVWVAGYNPVPGDVRVATLEMIAHWWRNTQQAGGRPSGNIVPASEFEPATDTGTFYGVPDRTVALLSPYMRVSMG